MDSDFAGSVFPPIEMNKVVISGRDDLSQVVGVESVESSNSKLCGFSWGFVIVFFWGKMGEKNTSVMKVSGEVK